MSVLHSLEQRLRVAGYRDCGRGVFDSAASRRTVALVEASSKPIEWAAKVDMTIRNEVFGAASIWARYVVIVINSQKTPELASAAAAFCRDVSKCRRLVAFGGQTGSDVLPFLELDAVLGGSGTPGYDLESIVERTLGPGIVATAFLDETVPVSQLQRLAEENEEHME